MSRKIMPWEEVANLFKEFVLEFERIPKTKEKYKDVNLGEWLKRQRELFLDGKLCIEKIEALDAVDLTWKVSPRPECLRKRKKVDETETPVEEIEITKDSSVRDLVIATRTRNALLRSGIDTIEDLTNKTLKDLSRIRNLGKKNLTDLLTVLKDLGFELKSEEVEEETIETISEDNTTKEPVFEEDSEPVSKSDINELLDRRLIEVLPFECYITLRNANCSTLRDISTITFTELCEMFNYIWSKIDNTMKVLEEIDPEYKYFDLWKDVKFIEEEFSESNNFIMRISPQLSKYLKEANIKNISDLYNDPNMDLMRICQGNALHAEELMEILKQYKKYKYGDDEEDYNIKAVNHEQHYEPELLPGQNTAIVTRKPKSNYNYFIVFAYTLNGLSYTGNCFVKTNRKIQDPDSLREVTKLIESENNLNNVVVTNYIENKVID